MYIYTYVCMHVYIHTYTHVCVYMCTPDSCVNLRPILSTQASFGRIPFWRQINAHISRQTL